MTNHTQGASAPSVFHFEKNQVRTIERNGEIWFVAVDVCSSLGLKNPSQALLSLDDDEKALITVEGLSRGNDQANIINESGLYSLILRSRKPEARRFKKWVTSEVLPSIRKSGNYLPGGDPAPAQLPKKPPLRLRILTIVENGEVIDSVPVDDDASLVTRSNVVAYVARHCPDLIVVKKSAYQRLVSATLEMRDELI